MPNWVRSKVTGISAEDLQPYISKDDYGTEYLDFEKIIPMPKELAIESSSRLDKGMEFIDSHVLSVELINSLSDEEKECLNLGFKGLYNERHYGFKDWYDWCRARWGTKWNSHDCDFCGDEFYISTAWSCPVPIFQKLSELLHKEIEIVYADEDSGYNTGEYVFENGEETYCIHPTGGSYEAFELYTKAWCEDVSIVMGDDGKWRLDWGDEDE